MSKAGTLAIVCVQYTICASVPGELTILDYILGATTYAECNVFSEFNISSAVLPAARSHFGCIIFTKSVFDSLALFFSWRYGIVSLSDLGKHGGIKVVWETTIRA